MTRPQKPYKYWMRTNSRHIDHIENAYSRNYVKLSLLHKSGGIYLNLLRIFIYIRIIKSDKWWNSQWIHSILDSHHFATMYFHISCWQICTIAQKSTQYDRFFSLFFFFLFISYHISRLHNRPCKTLKIAAVRF